MPPAHRRNAAIHRPGILMVAVNELAVENVELKARATTMSAETAALKRRLSETKDRLSRLKSLVSERSTAK